MFFKRRKIQPKEEDANFSTLDYFSVENDEKILGNGGKVLRIDWRIGGALIVLLVVWLAWAPLDKGLTIAASLVVSGESIVVQHPIGGAIEQVLVLDGDHIKKGQKLLKLDPTKALAELQALKSQYYSTLTSVERLQAQENNSKELVFSYKLKHAVNQVYGLEEAMAAQSKLFLSEKQRLSSEIRELQQNLSAQQSELTGVTSQQSSKRNELNLAQKKYKGYQELLAKGHVSSAYLWDLQRDLSRIESELSSITGRLGSLTHGVQQQRIQIQEMNNRFILTVQQDLINKQLELNRLEQQLKSYQHDFKQMEIVSPVDGYVVELTKNHRGEVINPSEPIMKIVPKDAVLVVNGELPVEFIDKVRTGDLARVQFSIFNRKTTPELEAVITHVSADRVVDKQMHKAYYRVQADISAQEFKKLHGLQLQPGMPAQLIVKTGARSVLNYLIKPLLDRAGTSMLEE